MDIETRLNEKIAKFEDIKKELARISNQIGGLSEQQRQVYNAGLEIKGQIDALVEMKQDADQALAGSKTAQLTLPEGVKPIVPEVVQ